MKRLAIAFAVGIIASLVSSDVQAQRRTPHYRRTPTISPHLNLFRADNGGLNSYIGSYSPRVQMRQFMDDTSRQIQYQQNALNRNRATMDRDIQLGIQQQLQQGTGQQMNMLQMRPSSAGGSRTAGTFMGHARYYMRSGSGGGGARGGGGGSRRVPLPTSGRALSGGFQ